MNIRLSSYIVGLILLCSPGCCEDESPAIPDSVVTVIRNGIEYPPTIAHAEYITHDKEVCINVSIILGEPIDENNYALYELLHFTNLIDSIGLNVLQDNTSDSIQCASTASYITLFELGHVVDCIYHLSGSMGSFFEITSISDTELRGNFQATFVRGFVCSEQSVDTVFFTNGNIRCPIIN